MDKDYSKAGWYVHILYGGNVPVWVDYVYGDVAVFSRPDPPLRTADGSYDWVCGGAIKFNQLQPLTPTLTIKDYQKLCPHHNEELEVFAGMTYGKFVKCWQCDMEGPLADNIDEAYAKFYEFAESLKK